MCLEWLNEQEAAGIRLYDKYAHAIRQTVEFVSEAGVISSYVDGFGVLDLM